MERSENRAFGRFGETVASEYMKKLGYSTLCRGWCGGGGELDLVCASKSFLVFVEVKTRRSGRSLAHYGRPASAVTEKKKQRLLGAVREYLRQNETQLAVRIDVIEVYITQLSVLGEAWYAVDDIVHMPSAVRG